MIAVIDYGVGNLFSLKSSLSAIGQEAVVTRDQEELDRGGSHPSAGGGGLRRRGGKAAEPPEWTGGPPAGGGGKAAAGHLPGDAAAV